MKKHVYEGIRRVLSLGLCLCLAAGYVPLPALAEDCGHVHGEGCYTVTTDCVHTHEADCWSDMDLQAAGEEADACGHICSEDTGCVTAVLSCGHVHDGDCGYAVAQAVEEQQPEEQEPEKQELQEQPKEQEPKEQPKEQPQEQEPKEQPKEQPKDQNPQKPQVKTVTAWTWVDEQETLDPETGKLYLIAAQDAPVFYEQIVEVLPQAIEATVEGETETLPLTHWESADYPQETGAYSGSYRFAASLPEGYALAEDAAALDVTVEFGGAVTLTANAVGLIVDGVEEKHSTFDEAMGWANRSTGENVTVKLYENAQNGACQNIKRDLTIDLNGYKLEKNGQGILNVGDPDHRATLTLMDSKGGGTGDIEAWADAGNVVVKNGEWGYIVTLHGELIMESGQISKVHLMSKSEIKGGHITTLILEAENLLALTVGSYDTITGFSYAPSVPAASLLAPGYAFRQNQNQKKLRYGELPILDEYTSLKNVIVDKCRSHLFEIGNPNCVYCNTLCTHQYDASTGLCTLCGAAHDHSFSRGICQGCGYACPHESAAESGICVVCGERAPIATIGDDEWSSLIEAVANVGDGGTIKLLRNVELTRSLHIKRIGITFNLDLNGHNLTQSNDVQPVLEVLSNMTLTDSTPDASKHGKITHAQGKNGEGVGIGGGVFRMTGGIICDNGNTGVLVSGDGTFEMDGGVIRNNEFGGVYKYGGATAILIGGAITNNTLSCGVDGIGVLTIGGSIQITGNTANGKPCNLFRSESDSITLEKPTSGFSVGITTASTMGTEGITIAKGSTAKVTKADFSGIFSDAGIECQAVTEENGEYVLRYYSAHDYTGTTTGKCTHCDGAHDHTGHFVNGVCQVCRYVCTHGGVTQSGGVYTCNACGEEMCVRIENEYGNTLGYCADFGQAVAALNDMQPSSMRGIVLLKDAAIHQPVTLQQGGSQYQLNIVLNGKKITGEPLTITGNIKVVFSANANSAVEAQIILENVYEVALFPQDYNISFQKITDKTGAIKKERGTASWEFSDSAQNWIHWDSIPDGAYTYENVTASCIPVRISVPSEGTMSYGGSMPESFQGARMEQNGDMLPSIVSGYTYTISWWLGQQKLAEKQVGNNVAFGPDNSDSWAQLAAGTYTVTCRMSAIKEGARDYVISKQVKLTVDKAPVGSVTAPTLNTGLTYTGQPQALVTGGSAQGGTLGYSLTADGTYTSTAPTGTDAGEYEVWYKVQGDGNHLDTAAQSLGTVTVARKDVTVTGTQVQASRTYDGTNTAVITSPGTVRGNVDGENLTVLPGTAVFDDKNAGTGKTVTFSGFTLGGSAKDNYNLTAQPGSTTADITPLDITAQVTPQDKDYDGTDTAAADVRLQGILPGDSLTLQTGTVRFAGKAAGKHKLIFTGFALDGVDSGNYSLTIPETSGTIRATNDYLDLTGTGLENSGSITLEGKAYPIVEEDGKYYVDLTGITGTYVTVYGYANAEGKDIHTRYPDSMTVHRLDRTNADGKGAKLTRIQELDNLLLYEGCSIRLTGNKGIRMITSIDEQTKKSLINGSLAGFTLEEYGTVVMKGIGEPTLNSTNSKNFAYSKTNRKDPVFAKENGRIQYTNVLVNFQPADYNTELTLRPYITLVDGNGNTVTLYGGCVTRTIHYIAQQNMNLGIYKPGSAGYKYLENILSGK